MHQTLFNLFDLPLLIKNNVCRLLESECPTEKPGYKRIAGKCYFFDANRQTFQNAADKCENMFKVGGKLVEPRSLEVNDLVYEASKTVTGSSSEYWLGIVFSEARNDYVYRFDKQLVTLGTIHILRK